MIIDNNEVNRLHEELNKLINELQEVEAVLNTDSVDSVAIARRLELNGLMGEAKCRLRDLGVNIDAVAESRLMLNSLISRLKPKLALVDDQIDKGDTSQATRLKRVTYSDRIDSLKQRLSRLEISKIPEGSK
ncbi:MAG: hypothetical protein RLZZ230_892 [Candidatus Parcubacteria bacterium]|jgi:hypothetical protein